jgi:uncharacterized metal-binding protein
MMGTHEDPLEIAAAPPAVLPLVYACSGCSAAAQLANGLAVRLDRAGLAEMSCIAGIGGDVPSLLKKARSGRAIVVLDGCPLHCARNCLARHAIPVGVHIDLSESGVRKRMHEDPSPEESCRVWSGVVLPRLAALQEGDARSAAMIQGDHAARRSMDKIT